jgi:glutamate racemase
MPTDPQGSIGIFDSGVGGLTVFARIAEHLPDESLIYLGDTARVPYGTKSGETVVAYARSCARLLLRQPLKLLVVACNTASAYALETLRSELDIPVLGVVEPGARAAIHATRNRRVGVIGTESTVRSEAYPRAIAGHDGRIQVTAKACPLFVPLAEEGWITGEVPEAVARTYLDPMRGGAVDTLVLGCTHYPLLKETIGTVMGPEVTLVDSADETAIAVAHTLDRIGCRAPAAATPPVHRFLASDAPENFARVGGKFLGRPIEDVSWVNFDLRDVAAP